MSFSIMGNTVGVGSAPVVSVQWGKEKAEPEGMKILMVGGGRKPTETRDMVCLEVGAIGP